VIGCISKGDQMINIDAEIYREFKCKADKCRHTCCKGWEIGIDQDTLDYYKKLDTALGNEIRQNIEEGDEAIFKLTADERCPFLMDNGLCRIIQELGDDGLCDICRLHPRFFEQINDINMAGVGLSCEKAAELLLSKNSLKFFICGSEKKIDIYALMEILGIDIPHDYLYLTKTVAGHLEENRIERIVDVFYKTEPIDDNWKKEVELLKNSFKKYLPELEIDKYQVIYQYIIFRQLELVGIFGIQKIIDYAIYSIIYIMLYSKCIGDDIEAVRRWSEQIEYSDENVICVINEV